MPPRPPRNSASHSSTATTTALGEAATATVVSCAGASSAGRLMAVRRARKASSAPSSQTRMSSTALRSSVTATFRTGRIPSVIDHASLRALRRGQLRRNSFHCDAWCVHSPYRMKVNARRGHRDDVVAAAPGPCATGRPASPRRPDRGSPAAAAIGQACADVRRAGPAPRRWSSGFRARTPPLSGRPSGTAEG